MRFRRFQGILFPFFVSVASPLIFVLPKSFKDAMDTFHLPRVFVGSTAFRSAPFYVDSLFFCLGGGGGGGVLSFACFCVNRRR